MFKDIEGTIKDAEKLLKVKVPLLTALLLILFTMLNMLLFFSFLNRATAKYDMVTIGALFVIIIALNTVITKLLLKRYRNRIKETYNEIRFLVLISDNSNEIMMLLDNYGSIINCNSALTRILQIPFIKIKNRPMRYLFNLSDIDENNFFKRLILDKLNEVFRGRSTELILPIKVPDYDDYKSIHIRLYPLIEDNELQNILAIGRLIGSDYITNKWLKNENSRYVMDNNISQLHMFCHRLTRNLEGKLGHSQIIMLQIALLEILVNAVEHGNFEIDFETKTKLRSEHDNYLEYLIENNRNGEKSDRKVYIEYQLAEDRVTYTIKDEGRGFDWETYMTPDQQKISNDFAVYFHGVGIQMVKSAFDFIQYNTRGNEVTLVKHFNGE